MLYISTYYPACSNGPGMLFTSVVNVAATTSPVVVAERATLICRIAVVTAAFATLPAVYRRALRSLTIRGTIGSVASGKSDGCTSRRRLCCAPKEIGSGTWCVSVVRTGAYRVGSAWIWVGIKWVQVGVVVVRVALRRIVLENVTVGTMRVEGDVVRAITAALAVVIIRHGLCWQW
jgi:hypothetical protein